ncbi:MAG: PAS domain S-box protein, partial [Nitrososphaera sp.]|nr:PAS domain S-box protein [Nitrososphaera sp.]
LINSEPILDPDTGRIKEAVATFVDITERKQTEEKLRRQNEYLAALHETTLALMNRLELNDLLETIVKRAGALMGTSHGYIQLTEPGETEMIVKIGLGFCSKFVGYRMKPGEGLAGKVWQIRQPIMVEDYRTWSGRMPDSSLDVIRAAIAIPLKSGLQTVGVLGLNSLEEGRAFGDEEIMMLSRFAQLASITLDNARLYTSAQQELAERKRVEEALRESEERYRAVVEQTVDCIYLVDADTKRVVESNAAFQNLLSYTSEETLRLTVYDFVAHDRESIDLRIHHLLTEKGPITGERQYCRKDGSVVDVEVSANLISYSGRKVVCTVARNITERKRAEEKLRRQNEYLAALHETTLALMNRLDLDGLLEVIVMRAGALMGTPHGYIRLTEPGETELVMRVGVGNNSNLVGHRLKPGEGLSGKVWQTGQPLAVKDYCTWSGRLPYSSHDIFHAAMAVHPRYGHP